MLNLILLLEGQDILIIIYIKIDQHMNELFLYIRRISDSLAENYNLNLDHFFFIYFASYIPFYLGYLLMAHGSTRKLNWKDIFGLNIKNKLQWNTQVIMGLFIHLFGRIMPYAYIILWGENLPLWLYFIFWGIIVLSIYLFIHKIFNKRKHIFSGDMTIQKKDSITSESEIKTLWKVYNETFEPLNKISPCKQSFDEHHFIEVLHDVTVKKYILVDKVIGIVGLGLITNNFKNTPWISEDYFKFKFPHECSKNLVYYFMGIAIFREFRGNKYSIFLLENIVNDLPRDVVIGFDHSKNINPMLHHFTRIIKQSRSIRRTHIDQQHYHVVNWKK